VFDSNECGGAAPTRQRAVRAVDLPA